MKITTRKELTATLFLEEADEVYSLRRIVEEFINTPQAKQHFPVAYDYATQLFSDLEGAIGR